MTDMIVIGIVAVIIGLAVIYILKEKKKGTRCIGCPASGQCASRMAGQKCACHLEQK